MPQELEIGVRTRSDANAVGLPEAFKRLLGALLAEIARNSRRQFFDCDGGTPQAETRHRREARRHEQIGLHALDRGRRAAEREADIGENIERQAPEHAMRQWRQIQAEQRLRAQHRQAERTIGQDRRADEARIRDIRQQQRIGPDQDADDHSADGAARGGLPPDQSAEKGRCKLRHRREGEKTDGRELRLADRAVIEIGEDQDREDRDAPHGQQQRADIGARR